MWFSCITSANSSHFPCTCLVERRWMTLRLKRHFKFELLMIAYLFEYPAVWMKWFIFRSMYPPSHHLSSSYSQWTNPKRRDTHSLPGHITTTVLAVYYTILFLPLSPGYLFSDQPPCRYLPGGPRREGAAERHHALCRAVHQDLRHQQGDAAFVFHLVQRRAHDESGSELSSSTVCLWLVSFPY